MNFSVEAFLFFFVFHNMANCHDRMMKYHAGARETHNFPDLFPHIFFIAMNLAVGTEGLCFHERAVITARSRIGIQRRARRTKLLAAVLFAAVYGNHQRNGFFFPFSFGCYIHQLILPCSTE